MAALEAQAASLNATFNKAAMPGADAIVNPGKWRNAVTAVDAASNAYRAAAASSGLLTTQQIRSVSQTEKYTTALQKQKLGLRDMIKHQGIMKEVYRDQLRMQRMTAQSWGTDSLGRQVTDITMPRNVPKDLDTLGRRLGMVGNMAASAGTQIVNLGKNMQWSGRQLMTGFTYPMVLFGAAAGVAAYKVEAGMAKINKVYDLNADSINNATKREVELGALRERTMDSGRKAAEKYGSSLEDNLAVTQELAATGLKGQNLTDSTDQVLRISALGDIDPAEATKMIISLQTAFKDTIKPGEDLGNALNFMNAASNASSLSLQDIAEATPRAASAIAQLGGTVEDMTVLLTSMREGGVQASEAANAIKSASTRIINPVPKAIDYYASLGKNIKGAAIDIEQLSKDSGGNLLKFLKMLGKEQQRIVGYDEKTGKVSEKETKRLKARGIATLFGTYQNNRLTASLTNLTDAYGGVANQSRKVMDLAKKTPAQLQAAADVSLAQMIDNKAGDLKKAWQGFKYDLAEMGTPFLSAATAILKVIGKVAKAFNGMDPGVKKMIMLTALVMALVGPIVMLGGLFLNLSGQFVKGAGSLLKFVGVSKLYTKEEMAAQVTTEAVNKALMMQSKNVTTLTAEIAALSAAYRIAQSAQQNMAASLAAGIPNTARIGNPTGFIGPQPQTLGGITTGNAGGGRYQLTSQEAGYFNQTSRTGTAGPTGAAGAFRTNEVRLMEARNRLAQDYMRANGQVARDASLTERRQAASARATAQMKTNLNGAGIATGAMSAGMLLMVAGTNDSQKNLGKYLLIGSLIVPMLAKMLVTTVAIGKAGLLGVANMARNTAAIGSGVSMAGRLSGAIGAAGGAARGFGVALNTALGPIGWAALAITAIVGTIIYAKGQAKKAAAELQAQYDKQKQAQDAISNSAERWADSVGKVVGSYERLPGVLAAIGGGDTKKANKIEKYIDYYKNEELPAGKDGKVPANTIQAYNALDTESAKASAALKIYTDLQVKFGATAKDAADRMRGFYIAAGESAVMADYKAQQMLATWGDIKNYDWSSLLTNQIDIFGNSSAGDIEQRATDLADTFSNALSRAQSPKAAKALVAQLSNQVHKGWVDVWDKTIALPDNQGKYFSEQMGKIGIDSAAEFEKAWRDSGDTKKFLDFLNLGDGKGWEGIGGSLVDSINLGPAIDQEYQITRGLKDLLKLGPDVKSLADVMNSVFVKAQTLTFDQQKADLIAMGEAMYNADGSIDGFKQATLESAINTYGMAHNIDLTGSATQDLFNFMAGVKNEAGSAAVVTNKIAASLQSLNGKRITIAIKAEQLPDIISGAVDSVKDKMVSDASYIFEQNQQAISDAAGDAMEAESNALQDRQEAVSRSLQKRQEAASRSLQDRQEAAMRAFEAKWEKKKESLTKFYDQQVKDIERTSKAATDADQVRQRLYEKEKKRLQDIADTANNQIDFNVALDTGNLDEAAKLQNDQAAKGMAEQMDAEQQRQEEKTQKLIERLDKKRERLEKAKDKALKRLEKVEDKMRRSLEKMQEAQQRALQAQQDAQSRALQKSQEAQSRALQKQQEMEQRAADRRRDLAREEFDYKMELFKALPAANAKQTREALRRAGLTLKDFGLHTLGNPGGIASQWGKYFEDNLNLGLRKGAAEAAKSNVWENVTGKIAKDMLKGFGFANLGTFQKFVETGRLPKKEETRHAGGEVGSNDRQSRAGLGGNGMHRTETMIRAQKGEYVINRKAYAQNRELVRGINSGRINGSEYKANKVGSQETGRKRITEGRGGYPIVSFGADTGVAPLGYTYGGGFRAMLAGMGPGIESGMKITRARKAAARARRKERKAAQNQQGPGNTNLPILPSGSAPGPLAESSLQFAADHRYGDALGDWENRCLSFVRQSLGAPGGVYDANSSWSGAKYKRGIKNYSDVPAGVPVFWYGGANGHVILSAGGGKAIGTDNTIRGQALPTTISDVANWWGQSPSGWSADINGKQVYPLRRGGEIKYDNTLISAHRGETVLPARLTEQFKENVRSGGGGDTYQVTLDLRGAMIKEEIDIEKAVYAAIDKRETRQGRRRVVD